MKSFGEIEGVKFRKFGFCPYNQAIKYKLIYCGESSFVYVDTYTELKEEIANLLRGTN